MMMRMRTDLSKRNLIKEIYNSGFTEPSDLLMDLTEEKLTEYLQYIQNILRVY